MKDRDWGEHPDWGTEKWRESQAAQDMLLTRTPYPNGEIIEVKDNCYVVRLQPHPHWPKTLMTADTLTVNEVYESYMQDGGLEMRRIEGQVGMRGALRSQTRGPGVRWLFVVNR